MKLLGRVKNEETGANINPTKYRVETHILKLLFSLS